MSKNEGSVPRLHGMIAESGLRYRGTLRLTVDDAIYALKILAMDLPRGTI
ncbi:MAG: hypothetical protein RXP86_07890 [Acidilobus sp.]